jgi:aldehyde dehydrogenase (NAD+)
MKTITTHYIDGAFVESHGREVMDVINPTNAKVIAKITLADEEDTRRAIAAAKRAFATYSLTTKQERMKILRRLHEVTPARINDLTAAMVQEYGGVVRFARRMVETGVNSFLAAEKALQELPMTTSWGKTTVTLEPVGVAGLITAWNANALFICLKLASAVASRIRAGRVVINNMTDDPQAPWGGFKYSGVGREYGKYGIEAFLEPKAILE